uniref:Uncharacterized protein n=1 Tax=Arundo donax TaxID=35708 RepID=A0A0A9CTJ8_ARUDO
MIIKRFHLVNKFPPIIATCHSHCFDSCSCQHSATIVPLGESTLYDFPC